MTDGYGDGSIRHFGNIDVISGPINNTGTITINGGGTTTINGNINNTGTITINGGGTITIKGTVISSGTIKNYGSAINNGPTSIIINSGTIINALSVLTNNGTLLNSGTISNNAAAIMNYGNITNAAKGTIAINGGKVDNSFGTIRNECDATIINSHLIVGNPVNTPRCPRESNSEQRHYRSRIGAWVEGEMELVI
jgi:hypothetical protein